MRNETPEPKLFDPFQNRLLVEGALRDVRTLLKHLGEPLMKEILEDMGTDQMSYRRSLVSLERKLNEALGALSRQSPPK